MKDPDSSPDVKDEEKPEENPEDMSLADLLGGGGAEGDAPQRVEARDDEPDSGMVKLAAMVASTSIDEAKSPSIAPPPPPPDPTGATPTAADPTGSQQVQTAAVAPAPAPAQRSSGPIYLLIVVVLIAAAGVMYVLNQKGDAGNDEALKAVLAEIEKQQTDAASAKAELESERKSNQDAIAALMGKLEELKTAGATNPDAAAEVEAEIEAAKAKEEELAEKEKEAEAKVAALEEKAEKAKTEPAADKPANKPANKKPAKKPAAAKVDESPFRDGRPSKKEKPAATKPSGNELDALLGGDKKEEEKKPTKTADDGTPKQLSRAQIQAGMAPVTGRAQKCAKYSTGTVQVQMTVGGNGRVKAATPMGSFANSTAGKCVAMLARTAKFPKFKDAQQKFTYPIVLK